jgi:hypothetical protein
MTHIFDTSHVFLIGNDEADDNMPAFAQKIICLGPDYPMGAPKINWLKYELEK